MGLRTDFALNSDGSWKTASGDLDTVENAIIEHTNDIVVSDDGHFKSFPDLGVGIDSYLGGPGNIGPDLQAKIIQELKTDGIDQPLVNTEDLDNIQINDLFITNTEE